MCRPIYVSWYRQLLHDMQACRMLSMPDCEHLPPDLPSVHACEFCDQTFDDVRSLRIHQRKSHREDLPEDWNRCQVTLETVRMHAVDGMPTCAYCLFKFANWRNLYEHLLQSRCKILASHATSTALPAGAPAAQPWVQDSETYSIYTYFWSWCAATFTLFTSGTSTSLLFVQAVVCAS